ncbi:5'-methylthioadenosine/S-adenosylhomocysteine nucleosidase [Pontibacillus yanchengensis]|uniref:5'-methylthioadenosine/S-adenosylhomocysteine nucleosidase n=2 Tax=Pontibacillus yanchengensis TaxID=462910 RepID=A0ACC7VFH5_9BACI|nr:5'-methylthioadenosine/S-adenosylhomocysteine nucleosidase [Pontibacillus yanchengensis]MYL33385.1 5'-methylthioadenosine/S-adenosylhomocysteine nucleosidase [Pontibacillus yanchengensis]MYL53435.1 5'-methylthioadenosine/S-adenosylhomocysteine nucleosidase [Pontibacillus yanchengensis]
MTIGIIGAMDEEIRILSHEMDIQSKETIASCVFYKGTLEGKEIVLTKSGIGKVNAAMATSILHERYQPSHIINTGSAGGFAKELKVGDLIISSEVRHHDVDVTAFSYEYGQVPDMPAAYIPDEKLVQVAEEATEELHDIHSVRGLIATGDAFMHDPARVEFVRSKFPLLQAAEMEAAAIAQVCVHYQTPFVIIRSLSDIAGKESSVSFDQYLATAAKHAATLIQSMLKNL